VLITLKLHQHTIGRKCPSHLIHFHHAWLKCRQETIELPLQLGSLLLKFLPLTGAQIDSCQAGGEARELLLELLLGAWGSGEEGLTLLDLLKQAMAIQPREQCQGWPAD